MYRVAGSRVAGSSSNKYDNNNNDGDRDTGIIAAINAMHVLHYR